MTTVRGPVDEIIGLLVCSGMSATDALQMWRNMYITHEQAQLVADAMRYVCDDYVLEQYNTLLCN